MNSINIITFLEYSAKDNTFFLFINNVFDTSLSTLSWPLSEYHNKTSFTQFILFARFSHFIDIFINAYFEYSLFFSLSIPQTIFGKDNWPVNIDKCSEYYLVANLISVNSRILWI